MSAAHPMTLTQKILTQHSLGWSRAWVQAGDLLQVAVDWTLASELAWNGMEKTYAALGRPPLANADRFFLAVDHTVDPVTLAHDAKAQRLTELSRAFAREQKLRHFYDANQTILHTRFYRDLVQPGQLVLGADSHTTSHGGMGALAIGLGGADIVAAMVLGRSWLQVPEAISVEYSGALAPGIGGKDVILRTLQLLKRNTSALERTVEYGGPAARGFSTDMRFTIANMTAELGGLNGIFEPDETVARWLAARKGEHNGESEGENGAALYFRADADAPYLERHRIALDGLGPLVARPYSPDNVVPVEEALGTRLDGCFIGACTTSEEELVLAGLLLEAAYRDRPAREPSPKCLMVPGDLSIQAHLREAGLLAAYQRAGFRVGPPGCSMCLGVASEKALPGETWLSSQNRNYHHRMGAGSHAWLASAATVAASSVKMEIADPRALLGQVDWARYASVLGQVTGRASSVPEVRAREPQSLETSPPSPEATSSVGISVPAVRVVRGRAQRFGSHVDTDAIIPGEFCHLQNVTELGEHAFEHVRPEFRARARAGGTVVVAEEAWGSGSSREHAVWALMGAGIQAVVARSFAFIHRRNLVNEGVAHLVVKDPAFYERVLEGSELELDLGTATPSVVDVASGQRFLAEPPGALATRLWREGGLVPSLLASTRATT